MGAELWLGPLVHGLLANIDVVYAALQAVPPDAVNWGILLEPLACLGTGLQLAGASCIKARLFTRRVALVVPGARATVSTWTHLATICIAAEGHAVVAHAASLGHVVAGTRRDPTALLLHFFHDIEPELAAR